MNTSVTVQPARRPGGASARRLARSPALRVSGRRLLSAIPVLWGVTLLSFLILNALPGDAASAQLGLTATPAELAHWVSGTRNPNCSRDLITAAGGM